MPRRWVLALVVGVLLSACGGGGADGPVGAQPPARPSIYALVPPTTDPATLAAAARPPAATFHRSPDDVVLPDPTITPGAVFDGVQSSDICELHYTQGIRQPRFNDKVEAFANYGVSIRDRDIYQVDHLIPVSLGGSNAEENLWPQPYDDAGGAAEKDLVERQLRGLVCSNLLPLADAQAAIAVDWWQAYTTYMGLPIEPGSDGLEPWRPPTHAPGEVVNGGLCPTEGEVGYTVPKHVALTCTVTGYGELRWQKRY